MNEHLILGIKAAIEAGQKIMTVYKTDFSVDYKEDTTPLTVADTQANQIIIKHLEATNLPIISEECDLKPFEERRGWDKLWMVDPLDGTKEFVQKNDEFTVNIALIENAIPTVGIVYAPAKKTLYYGSSKGAFLIENVETFLDFAEENAVPLTQKEFDGNAVISVSRSHISEETNQYMARVKAQKAVKSIQPIAGGSSLKFCHVASGLSDVYPRFSPTMEWDTAAGDAICRAVGVKVTIGETDEALKYNKEDLLNPDFIVNPKFYDTIDL